MNMYSMSRVKNSKINGFMRNNNSIDSVLHTSYTGFMPDINNISSIQDPVNNGVKAVVTENTEAHKSKVEEKPLPPIRYPPFLWEKSQSLIKEIEQKLQSKTIAYYINEHTTMNTDNADYFFSHVRDLQPESSLALILVSSGGEQIATWRIANILRNYCNNLIIVVPSRCASAATLLALSAEKILLGPAGFLTAIDTSLTHPLNPRPNGRGLPSRVSVDQISRIKEFLDTDLKNYPGTKSTSEILFANIHPVVFAELQRASNLSKMIAKNMMQLRTNAPSEEDRNRIADMLNDSYPTHGYPIVLKEAQKIGLPAEPTPPDLNPLLWELVKMYSLASKKIITNITPTYFHLEHVPVIIESVNKRTFYRMSYYKRFMSQPSLGWIMENDKTGWLSATPNSDSNEHPKISEIEL